MSSTRLSRRTLLRGLGVSPAFVPLLMEDYAQAARAEPKRMMILQWTNGVVPDRFFPKGTETSFTLPECTAPMAPHQGDAIFMSLDLTVAREDPLGHGSIAGHQSLPHLLTGALSGPTDTGGEGKNDRLKGNAISVDQHVAKALQARSPTPFKSLELGVQTTGSFFGSDPTEAFISFNGPTTNKTWPDGNKPDESPYSVFKRLFQGQAMPGSTMDTLLAQRKSVLDVVGRNLTRLEGKLGPEDKERLGEHLQSIRKMEEELNALGTPIDTGSCQATAPAPGVDPKDKGKLRELTSLQMDLAVTALKCDLTRVVTFMLPNASGSNVSLAFLGDAFKEKSSDSDLAFGTGSVSHHEIAHEGGTRKVAADKWFVEVFADLVKRFKDTKSASGARLFDASLLLFANHMGEGPQHSLVRVPFILAGSAGVYKTGRWLDLKGTPHNGLLGSMARAMDVPTDSFGTPKYDTTAMIDQRLRG